MRKNGFSLGCVVVGSVVECKVAGSVVAKCQTVQMRKPNQETQLKSSQAKHHSGERKYIDESCKKKLCKDKC